MSYGVFMKLDVRKVEMKTRYDYRWCVESFQMSFATPPTAVHLQRKDSPDGVLLPGDRDPTTSVSQRRLAVVVLWWLPTI